jgi:hypothetical protein
MNPLFTLALLQEATPPGVSALGASLGMAAMIVWVAFAVLMIASMWKVFTKAGEPGWAAIVPIYNIIVLLKIAGKPIWWFFILWLFIPVIFVVISLASNFGKGVGFAIGLLFLPFIFYPVLAFGDAKYQPVVTAKLQPALA